MACTEFCYIFFFCSKCAQAIQFIYYVYTYCSWKFKRASIRFDNMAFVHKRIFIYKAFVARISMIGNKVKKLQQRKIEKMNENKKCSVIKIIQLFIRS